MDAHNMVYPCDEILFSNKKEQTTETCNNTNDLINIMLSEKDRHKCLHNVWFHLYEISREGKAIEIESRSVVA